MSGLKKFNINDLKEVEKYSINRLSDYEINNLKFIKVMFGTASRAGSGFEYKIDKVNETDNWHPETKDSKDIGGFNFSVEEKILRWLVRGDTLYDVIIPENTEVYDCESPSAPHGVFRSNKMVDIKELNNYKIHPSNIKNMIKNSDTINHLVEIVNK